MAFEHFLNPKIRKLGNIGQPRLDFEVFRHFCPFLYLFMHNYKITTTETLLFSFPCPFFTLSLYLSFSHFLSLPLTNPLLFTLHDLVTICTSTKFLISGDVLLSNIEVNVIYFLLEVETFFLFEVSLKLNINRKNSTLLCQNLCGKWILFWMFIILLLQFINWWLVFDTYEHNAT